MVAPVVKDGVEWPWYRLTSDGRVQTRRQRGMKALAKEWRDMRPGRDAKGYLNVTLCGPAGERWGVRVHRLIAAAFAPNPSGLPCVRHIDGDPNNNAANNLAWGSYRDNEQDKHRHGTYWERCGGGKLSVEQVLDARASAGAGEKHEAIAKRLGCSRPTVTRAVNGATWRHV